MSDSILAKNYNFLVSGDSISRGIIFDEEKGKYAVLEKCYVALVQRRLKGIVQNASRFGSTLIRGICRLGKDIAKGRPDIVLIEYGGNDCDFAWNEVAAYPNMPHEPQTDLTVFEDTLTAAVASLKAQDIAPVLMTLPPLNADSYIKWVSKQDPAVEGNILKWLGSVTKIYWWQERYSASIVRVAEATGTRWIDIRGAFLKQPDFTALICRDGIHPNEMGHALIAQTIVEYISSGFAYLLAEGPVPVSTANERMPWVPAQSSSCLS
jgi:lysophospholipase L1-like esterase